MEFESVTMHLDRTFGLMYREDGGLRCTCGWSEFGGTSDPTGSTESSSGSGSHTPPAATSSAAAPDAGSQGGSGSTLRSPFGADSRKPQEIAERDAQLLAGEPEPLKIIVPVEIEEA